MNSDSRRSERTRTRDTSAIFEDGAIETWTRPGQCIAGKLLAIRRGREFANRQSHLAVIRRRDGSRVVVQLTRLLDAEFEDRDVRIGDRIKIKFVGTRRSKSSGRSYKKFRLSVQ
jgi:uncharacterized OB-fold protein